MKQLYNYLYLPTNPGGYFVYRFLFDPACCSLEAGVRAHKEAVFVTESAALDYCAYRNWLTGKYGTDDIALGEKSRTLGGEGRIRTDGTV